MKIERGGVDSFAFYNTPYSGVPNVSECVCARSGGVPGVFSRLRSSKALLIDIHATSELPSKSTGIHALDKRDPARPPLRLTKNRQNEKEPCHETKAVNVSKWYRACHALFHCSRRGAQPALIQVIHQRRSSWRSLGSEGMRGLPYTKQKSQRSKG